MEKAIEHGKNCIAELLNYLLLAMAELFLFSKLQGTVPGLLRMSVPLALPLFYYLVRLRVHRFGLFALLHLLPPVLIWMGYGDSLLQRILFTAMGVIQAFLSLHIRVSVLTRQDRRDYGVAASPPVTAVVMGMGLYLFSNLYVLVQIALFYLILYFIYLYLGNFLHYADISRKTTGNIPLKNIFGVNFALVGGFASICAFFIMTFAGRNIIRILIDGVVIVLRRIAAALFRFLAWLFGRGREDVLLTEEMSLAEEELEREAATQESGILVDILNFLFQLIGTLIMLAIFASVIYGIILLIRQAFAYRLKKITADGEEKEGDIVEKLERKREKRESGQRGLFKTPDEKVRKIFRDVLRKQYLRSRKERKKEESPDPVWEKVFRYGTARESLELLEGEQEAAVLLVRIYEKARYAKESCTGEDVKEARRLAGKL